jgi:hypothetical protein
MTFPLRWETDLKNWIREWQQADSLDIKGLKERQRVPQLKQNVSLTWKRY